MENSASACLALRTTDMKAAFLLIDMQNDYLDSLGLEPSRGALCAASAKLLNVCRAAALPIVHIWTTVRCGNERMPHWRADPKERCVEGTFGHATPPALQPQEGELVVHKQYFSAFSSPALETHLNKLNVDTLILAGVHLRACVRTTAIDAYQKRFSVWIAGDAAADDDPVHAAITRQYLSDRFVRFLSVDEIGRIFAPGDSTDVWGNDGRASHDLPAVIIGGQPIAPAHLPRINHISPLDGQTCLFRIPICGGEQIRTATQVARNAWCDWSESYGDRRREFLVNLASRLEANAESLARQITVEIGKPIGDSRQEVRFAERLVQSTLATSLAAQGDPSGNQWYARRQPLGVVAIITPWNNPLAIALGKIAPAVAYGNAVVWKPALPGAAVALAAMEILFEAGLPSELVSVVQGDHQTAVQLMSDTNVDAVALTGSSQAGNSAQVICARRRIPLQAELGGNNAAIVWSDADLPQAATYVAQGAFGSAGQRCTATRRVIVQRRCRREFLELLKQAVADLRYGDPLDERTNVGPVVSKAAWIRISGVVDRARAADCNVITPPVESTSAESTHSAAFYFPPTIVCCNDPTSEIVVDETFGPVVVVQEVTSWEQAIELCNGVSQGLIATLFSRSKHRIRQFLADALAGILKVNVPTAGAEADAPFCGWKSSGIGPPEHGIGDVEFYARWQTVYCSNSAQQDLIP